VNFRINLNLIEQLGIPKWSEQFSGQDWSEIDYLFSVVIKPDPKGVGGNNFKPSNTADWVTHKKATSRVQSAKAFALL
jgi:hypothetical protein